MLSTYSCAGGIQDARRGFDTTRFVKSSPAELLLGNENVDVGTIIRNDNSIVVEHVHSVNSIAEERMLGGLLERNREEVDLNTWLAPVRITGGLNISDDITKSATQTKLSMLLQDKFPKRQAKSVRLF